MFWTNCHQKQLPDNCGTMSGVNWRREVDIQNNDAMLHMDYKHFEYSQNTVMH